MSVRFSAALLLAAATASSAAAQSVTYSQGTFDPNQWSFSQVSLTGPVTATQSLSPSDGNPGNNWLHTWSIPLGGSGTRYRVSNINSTFTYDPRVNGALSSLTFSYDVLGVAGTGFSPPFFGRYVPTLRQGGQTFFMLSASPNVTTNWTTFSVSRNGTTDWVDPNNQGGEIRPDFSTLGSTMEFGYIMTVGSSCSASECLASSFSSRLDNFSVTATTVSTVPEPSTYALMAAGLGALLLVQRRRRQQA